MTTKSATVAPKAKVHKYYGIEYRFSVKEMASQARNNELIANIWEKHELRKCLETGVVD